MKLVNRAAGNWHYVLDQTKFVLLKKLLEFFPLIGAEAAPPMSKTDTNPRVAEWNHLLYMALADHRKELEQQAMNLLTAEKFASAGGGQRADDQCPRAGNADRGSQRHPHGLLV
jgi:hypothetical protein